MRDENEDLVHLANMLITGLDSKQHGELIDRWCGAVSDGLTKEDVSDIKEGYEALGLQWQQCPD